MYEYIFLFYYKMLLLNNLKGSYKNKTIYGANDLLRNMAFFSY